MSVGISNTNILCQDWSSQTHHQILKRSSMKNECWNPQCQPSCAAKTGLLTHTTSMPIVMKRISMVHEYRNTDGRGTSPGAILRSSVLNVVDLTYIAEIF